MVEGLVVALRLVLVSPGDRTAEATAALIEAALQGGVTAVLLRERHLEASALGALAARARQATTRAGAALLVSNDVELARACGADGVQLGHGGGTVVAARAALAAGQRAAWVGRSAHWPLVAEDLAADYVMLSPFGPTFRSRSRPRLTQAQVRVVLARPGRPPVVALGGLDAAAVAGLPRELAGVAVVRALADAPDPRAAARVLRAAVESHGLGAAAGESR
jgi:thiamine-phosphate pyrophosphorylase